MQQLGPTLPTTNSLLVREHGRVDRDPFQLVDFSHWQPTSDSIWDFTTKQRSRVYSDPSTCCEYFIIKDFRYIYAGMLYRAILHSRAPEVLCVWDQGEIYGAVRHDNTFVDTYTYHKRQGNPNIDPEGLAQIVTLSFLLGDAEYMNRAEGGSLGVVGWTPGIRHYRKNYGGIPLLFAATAPHSEVPLFALRETWLDQLEGYARGHFRLVEAADIDESREWTFPTRNDLQQAAEQIAAVPYEQWRSACAFCEALGASRQIDRRAATFGLRARSDYTIEEIVLNRVARFQALVRTSATTSSSQRLLDPQSKV